MQDVIISQRQRSLAMWHDHATILRNGFIMVTLHRVYDAAVFFTNEEYFNKTGKRLNVQCEVEKPEIYVLVLGSSSVEDQAIVIPDRVEYLSDLSTPVVTTNGKLHAHNVYIHTCTFYRSHASCYVHCYIIHWV